MRAIASFRWRGCLLHMKDTMLLFDLDGTLWDSAEEVAQSWNIVMHKYYPESPVLSADDIHAVMGKTMDEIAMTVLTDLTPHERGKLFKECEEFEIEYVAEHGGVLFEGVEETLKTLQEDGWKMAIVSNCQTGYIDAFYRSMNMKQYFCDMEEWGNTKLSKAENIRLVMERNHFEKAVYIGDTVKDQEAAKGAGIPFIHASYGFGEVDGADAAISSLPSLLSTLNNMQF